MCLCKQSACFSFFLFHFFPHVRGHTLRYIKITNIVVLSKLSSSQKKKKKKKKY